MSLQALEIPESRETLMNRYFERSWVLTENAEEIVLEGRLKGSGVKVSFRGFKSKIPPVLMAFFDAMDALGEESPDAGG